MFTVYIWLQPGAPDDRGVTMEDLKDLGHASTAFDTGEYFSLWPKNPDASISRLLFGTDAMFMPNLHADIVGMERDPNHQVAIDGLNERAMKRYLEGIRSRGRYYLWDRNCSTIIGRAIHRGIIRSVTAVAKESMLLGHYFHNYTEHNEQDYDKLYGYGQAANNFVWSPDKLYDYALFVKGMLEKSFIEHLATAMNDATESPTASSQALSERKEEA